jgi:hypothetical protein
MMQQDDCLTIPMLDYVAATRIGPDNWLQFCLTLLPHACHVSYPYQASNAALSWRASRSMASSGMRVSQAVAAGNGHAVARDRGTPGHVGARKMQRSTALAVFDLQVEMFHSNLAEK